MGVWQKCSRTQGSKEILREMDKGSLRSLEKCFLGRNGERKKKNQGEDESEVLMVEENMKEEAKKKKRKTRHMGGQNSTPTLKTQQVAKSTQSN